MPIAVLHADAGQAELVCRVLTAAGHQCHRFNSSKEMLNQLRRILDSNSCSLVVLDLQLPDADGLKVLHWLRENLTSSLPILFLTKGSADSDIAAVLDAGANDYLIKPIRQSELTARVQVLLRRAYPNQGMAEQIRFGQYVFESGSGRLSIADVDIDVTQKEFDLALLFFRNLGRPLSRAYILETVWAHDFEGSSRTMDTHVSRLRGKLQLRPDNGFRLVPVYSYGYRLEQVSG